MSLLEENQELKKKFQNTFMEAQMTALYTGNTKQLMNRKRVFQLSCYVKFKLEAYHKLYPQSGNYIL